MCAGIFLHFLKLFNSFIFILYYSFFFLYLVIILVYFYFILFSLYFYFFYFLIFYFIRNTLPRDTGIFSCWLSFGLVVATCPTVVIFIIFFFTYIIATIKSKIYYNEIGKKKHINMKKIIVKLVMKWQNSLSENKRIDPVICN